MKIYTFFGLLTMLLACTKTETKECPDDIQCTEVFVTIGVKVQDAFGNDILLSSSVSALEISGKELYKEQEKTGYHTIVTDLSKGDISKNGSVVIFKGYKKIAGEEVLICSEKFIIGHDCCHVLKLAGKDIITIP